MPRPRLTERHRLGRLPRDVVAVDGRVVPPLARSDPLAEARERDERARVRLGDVLGRVVLLRGRLDERDRVARGDASRAPSEAVEGVSHLDQHGDDVLVRAVRIVGERVGRWVVRHVSRRVLVLEEPEGDGRHGMPPLVAARLHLGEEIGPVRVIVPRGVVGGGARDLCGELVVAHGR